MVGANLQETEVKLYTPDLERVQKALESARAALLKPRLYERNIRYEDARGSLGAGGMVLRLRQDDRARLTFKQGDSYADGIVRRFEAEVAVSDFETMHIILERLGYETALMYEKYRTTYALDGAEIVLDELPYGNFTEIEADADTIERAIERLGLGGSRRMEGSYTDIFVEVKAWLGLEVRDLSFENFAGVEVGDVMGW